MVADGAEPKVMKPFVETYICVYAVPLKVKEGMVCALEILSSNELKSTMKKVVFQSCVPPVIGDHVLVVGGFVKP